MKIGSKIQKIREIRGYTQDSVAEELGISQSAYCNIEKNNSSINVDKLILIADFLNISVSKLLEFDEKNILDGHNKVDTTSKINPTLSNNEKRLYEARIKHLEEEVDFLRRSLMSR